MKRMQWRESVEVRNNHEQDVYDKGIRSAWQAAGS